MTIEYKCDFCKKVTLKELLYHCVIWGYQEQSTKLRHCAVDKKDLCVECYEKVFGRKEQ